MECFIAWAAFGFIFVQWRAARAEADHYRDGYFRIMREWGNSIRRHD